MPEDDEFASPDEEDSEEQQEEVPATAEPTVDPALSKLRKENHSLRERLRRSEMVAKYGENVVELIPSELPLKKWEEYAGKLAAALAERGEGAKTEGEDEGAAPVEPTPSEKALAAVTTAPSAATAAPSPQMSAKDLLELGKKDPARAEQIIRSQYAAQQ